MPSQELTTLRQIIVLFKRIKIHPVYFVVPVLLSLFAAAFEGVGMGLLVPMLEGFFSKDFSFLKEVPVLGTLLGYLPESISARDRSLFVFLLGIFVVAIFLKNILKYLSGLCMAFISVRALHHLRKLVFSRYLSFGKLYFDKSNVGHHTTVLADFTKGALKPLLVTDKFMHAFFSLIGYLVVMTVISWKLTIFALPLLFFLHIVVKKIINRIRALSSQISDVASKLGKKAVDILSAMTLVKSYCMEDEERNHYTEISDQRAKFEFRMEAVQKLIHPLQEIITLIAIIILFSGMLYLMVREGETSPPSFIVYFYLVLNATGKFSMLTNFRSHLASAHGPLKRVSEVLNDQDKYAVPSGDQSFSSLKESIEFKNLNFKFPDGKEVLSQLSFKVEKGSMTAIVGPTGAGKTTIINLLLRFYDCPSGTIFMDGEDVRNFNLESLRKHMSLVSQDVQILHESLRHNVAYGLGDVSDEDVTKAINRARLTEYVSSLPEGLDTMLGDRGVKLSGGEKQRVSIARALLKGVEILILDEATSSLDSETEKLIQEAIDDAISGKTAIVIAHRLSTIKHADKIVVIENGRCVEQGSLDELLESKGRFAEMWEAQRFT